MPNKLVVISNKLYKKKRSVSPSFAKENPQEEHLCFRCQSQCEKEGFDVPKCSLSTDIKVIEAQRTKNISEDESLLLETVIDPVTWAKLEFNFRARWYQSEILRCSAKKKVIRMGRRTGKSWALAVDTLFKVYMNDYFKVLIITPYQDQAELLINIITEFIDKSSTIKSMVTRFVKSPNYKYEFSNGSEIVAVTAGVKSGSGGAKIRGRDAHAIYLDEADYLGEKELESVLAILASHKDSTLWASSTPSGNRDHFYRWCTDKSLGFKEFHYPASISPEWTKETEKWLKAVYTKDAYAKEFLAEFVEPEEGVFPLRLIDNSLEDYNPLTLKVSKDVVFGMGVDWNETSTGVHICIVGYEPRSQKFRLYRKEIISKQDFTQLDAVQRIIDLNTIYEPKFIYVDYGFGTTQVEQLHKYGKAHPSTGLWKKVKPIQMGGTIEVHDPVQGKVKKRVKPFATGLAVRRFEQNQVVLPRCEYKGVDSGSMGLVDQLLAYRVVRYSKDGSPVYSAENDHTLTAWILAMYGFWMEFTDIVKPKYSTYIGVVNEEQSSVKEEEKYPPGMGIIVFKKSPERIREEKKNEFLELAPEPRGFDIPRSSKSISDISTLNKEKQRINRRQRSNFGNIRGYFSGRNTYRRKMF